MSFAVVIVKVATADTHQGAALSHDLKINKLLMPAFEAHRKGLGD
jgi:hypothetical protein